jgi:vitamin B12 transporter
MLIQALPPEPPGEVIVVTGTALPDFAAGRGHHVDQLDARDLSDAPAHALDHILLHVPGLQLFRRSDSTSGHPTSQGVTLRALGGNASSRALLVLDGVPQADPFGGWVNWPAYDPAGLERARIVRGAGSVSHGPGALAGVIELDSRGSQGLDASMEAGSRESVAGRAYLGLPISGARLTINAQAGRSAGFVPVSKATRGPVDRAAPYEEASLRARLVAPLGDRVEMQVAGLAFADERERGLPFTGNRTRGADLSTRFVGRGRWQWSALGYLQSRNLRSSFASVDEDRTTASRVSLQDSVPSQGYGGSFEIRPPVGDGIDVRFGADARLVSGQSRELYAFVAGDPTRRRIAGGASRTLGLFAETSLTRGAMALSAGARIDHWRIAEGELAERLLAGGTPIRDDSYAARTGTQPTARASALLEVARGIDLRLSAYTGWRMPTLNELFRPFRAGPDATAANPLLAPEKLRGIEAGVRRERGPFELELTAFANRLSGAIANVTLGQGPGVFPGVGFVAGAYRQRHNVDAVRVKGIEGSASLRQGPWSFGLGASLTHARVQANGDAAALDGLRPAQTPSIVVSGSLSWREGGKSASLIVRHVGAQFEDDANDLRLPSATTVDAFVGWPLAKGLQLIARGQNLVGEEVAATITETGTVERATPRTFWLGLRFRSD